MAAAPESSSEALPEYALPDLLLALRSTDESQRHTAIFMLSELLNFAYDEDGRLLGDAMRKDGLSSLVLMLADPNSPLEITQQVLLLLGNLCSDAVDSESALTKRALLALGAERFLFHCLDSSDQYVLLFTCGVLQNVCHDEEWARRTIAAGIDRRLEALLHSEDETLVRYCAGALKNISVTTNSKYSSEAEGAIAVRGWMAAMQSFRHRWAIKRIGRCSGSSPLCKPSFSNPHQKRI